jgi:methylmalonyl-CoA mutase C-terminal domain/subunit
VVFGGGIIPDEDIPALHEAGVSAVFTPGTPLEDIEAWVDEHLSDE